MLLAFLSRVYFVAKGTMVKNNRVRDSWLTLAFAITMMCLSESEGAIHEVDHKKKSSDTRRDTDIKGGESRVDFDVELDSATSQAEGEILPWNLSAFLLGDVNKLEYDSSSFYQAKINAVAKALLNQAKKYDEETNKIAQHYVSLECRQDKLNRLRATNVLQQISTEVERLKEVRLEEIDVLIHHMNELLSLTVRAEHKVADVEKLLGECMCQKDTRLLFTSWGTWCPPRTINSKTRGKYINRAMGEYLGQNLFKGKTVAIMGTAAETYSQHMLADGGTNRPVSIVPYDTEIQVEESKHGSVRYANLARTQRIRSNMGVFDWIMSMEVVEHLPQEFEDTYIRNILRHARVGVVVSWAFTGQEGTGHFNERPADYVLELFYRRGFIRDNEETLRVRGSAKRGQKNDFFFRNVYVFLRDAEVTQDPDEITPWNESRTG